MRTTVLNQYERRKLMENMRRDPALIYTAARTRAFPFDLDSPATAELTETLVKLDRLTGAILDVEMG